MAIKDLEVRQGNVDVVVDVIEKGEIREFQKFGRTGRVCNAKVKDETGEIKLTLWNEQIDKINVGDKVHITNGYVSEFQGEKQLTTGKFGKLEVVEKGSSAEAPAGEPKEEETSTENTSAAEEESIEEENVE
ncbi:DNA-binding protein [Candidatus Woesearchaeota archaeon]|nr:DNA-binding protein [Candidatus Woesearchaeota archaeon]